MLTTLNTVAAVAFFVLSILNGHGAMAELCQLLAAIFGGLAVIGLVRRTGKIAKGIDTFTARQAGNFDRVFDEILSLTATLAVKDTTIAALESVLAKPSLEELAYEGALDEVIQLSVKLADAEAKITTLESRLTEMDAIADEAVEYEADDDVACNCAMTGGLCGDNGCPCDCHDDEHSGCHCRCPDCHDSGCENCVEGYVQVPPMAFEPAAKSPYAGYTSGHFLRDLVRSTEVVPAAHAATDAPADYPECPVCGDDPDCMCEATYDDDVAAAKAEVDELDDLEIDELDDDDDDDSDDDKPLGLMNPKEYAAWITSCPDLSFLADALPPESTTTVDTDRLTPKAR